MTTHRQQVEFLKNSVVNNRVPQAIIFNGPKGVGKKQIALDFIKQVHSGEMCGQDLIEIELLGKEIQIEQIRELQKDLSFKPQFSDRKIVIINKVEAMNKLAQNCFLKTLEEPKSNALFILITDKYKTLLPTIISRCAVLKFYNTKAKALDKNIAQKMQGIIAGDLESKFVFAEKISKENGLAVQNFFENLISYLRQILLANIEESRGVVEKIKLAQKLQYLVNTTNINKRLVLENLMLNI